MPSTHTADFSSAALKAIDLEAVEKVNVGLETDLARKHVNVVADAPEIRIQDKTASAPEVNQTTLAIVADGGVAHFRAGTTTFAEGGVETKGDVKFQSSTGDTTHVVIDGASGKLELQDGGLALKLGSNVSVTGGSAVVQEITGPHARESAVLKKYPEVALSSNVQSGYVVTASSQLDADARYAWKAFDHSVTKNNDNGWQTALGFDKPTGNYSSGGATFTDTGGTDHTGQWIKLQSPHAFIADSVTLYDANNTYRNPESLVILGSNDDSTWHLLYSNTSVDTVSVSTSLDLNSSSAYKYHLLVIKKISTDGGAGSAAVWINEIEYYGYEETDTTGDSSVDVTFKCAYNTPDLTSASLYIDAKETGSGAITDLRSGSSLTTVTANQVTYDSTEKAWVLSGAATSNIVTGDLGFEGDQPHTVSAWVKADQLNGRGLFHLGTAEGESEGASRVGFVDDSHISWGGEDHYFSNAEWHNVTYTYNGEGSDKKLYLDGRLVGTASNEDTFGDYPPFAMSTYSEYGYTVSAGSDDNGGWGKAWKAFNDVAAYNASDSYLGTFTFPSGNPDTTNGKFGPNGGENDTNGAPGDWLKIELPHSLVLNSLAIIPRYSTSYESERLPKSGNVWASNDNTVWVSLTSWTNRTTGTDPMTTWLDSNQYSYIVTNATKGYKYFALQWTQTNGWNEAAIGNMKLLGHRENDLVRFPDPTNVLKYPHVVMTDYVQRGYVASASGENLALNPPRAAYTVFAEGGGSGMWDSGSATYATTGNYDVNTNLSITLITLADGTTQRRGHWVKLRFPRKILLSHYYQQSSSFPLRRPDSVSLLGSDDDINWYIIKDTFTVPNQDENTIDVNATTAYRYIMYMVHSISGSEGRAIVNKLRYYGTEEDADVVARIGDGYDGKVRNLRVFSTALSDDRVQEIFDADKDEFGLAKSSVSVYRGHLGIGTTEPKAALTVMDEVGELEEFPPRPMTGFETYMEGHGMFRSSASYERDTSYNSYLVFNKNNITSDGFHGIGGDYDDSTAPSPANAQSGETPTTEGIVYGSYIQLDSPYRIRVSKMLTSPRVGYETNRGIEAGLLVGQNEDGLWDVISRFSGLSYTKYVYTEVDISSGKYYQRHRLIATHAINADLINQGEIRYFGIREQGASTLHNGELTLTRNLTVHRIGPALDADDTPRRDRLVVEYNTTTNPTENGVVKDTSGRGNHGFMYGAYYDPVQRALAFDGSDDYIITGSLGPNLKGNQQLTASFWIQMDADVDMQFFGVLPPSGEADLKAFGLRSEGDSTNYNVRFNVWSSDYLYNETEFDDPVGKWIHIVVIYIGGTKTGSTETYDYGNPANRRLFINGTERFTPSNTTYSGAVTGSATDLLDLDPNSVLILGKRISQTGYRLNGHISNYKLYDVALTTDEAKRLYNMGRCDEGHHVVNFSKTKVGIGLGDGEVPQGDMHVRGHVCIGPGVVPLEQWYNPALTVIQHSEARDNARPGAGIQFGHIDDPGHGWMLGLDDDGTGGAGSGSEFVFEHLSRGIRTGYGAQLSSGYLIGTINNFTGQHRCFIRDIPFTKANELEGLIVSSDQNKYVRMSGGIETGSNAITINESLPYVSLSNVALDKATFGVISLSEDPTQRVDSFGNIKSMYPKEKGDTRVYINSVGEGAIWVTDINGPLESGDYITTSNVAGYGQKQDDDILHNYTVAKITMDCDFNPATQPIKRIKRSNVVETHYTGLVPVIKPVPHEFVTTVVDADDIWSNVTITPPNVTYAEWSNLEASVQNTYTLEYTSVSNVVYDVKYTKTTVSNVTESEAWDAVSIDPPTVNWTEYSNLEANVQSTYSVTFTKTTVEEKTPEEWSALDADAQALWSVQYYDMEEQEVDTDYPGAVAHDTVTNTIENELDEHGQIQWEDHPTDTEKAYKLRFLDATGAQTDEANCVYRAAFVGCTYHCG